MPVSVATVESIAIVTAAEPLYEVPLKPVPIVSVFKLEPNATPEIVLLANLAFVTLPSSILLVVTLSLASLAAVTLAFR